MVLDAATMGELIPVIAVIAGSAMAIVRMVMRADVRKLELKLQMQQTGPVTGGASDEVKTLREELAQLRDTSTQFDVSLQHTLERLDHRLEFLERKVADASAPAASAPVEPAAKADPLPQTVGRPS